MSLVEAIRLSRLNGEYGTGHGIANPWRTVEPEVHDVAHAVILRMRISRPNYLRHDVHARLSVLRPRQVVYQEACTIALEFAFLKKKRAFDDDGGEWLRTVCTDVGMRYPLVQHALQNPMIPTLVRRLEARLRYHSRPR